MKTIKSFAVTYPVIFSTVAVVFATLLTEIPLAKTVFGFLDFQSASYLTGVLEQGGVTILLVLIISRLGLTREAGFTRPGEWKQVWLVWPALLLSLLNMDPSPFDGAMVIDFSRPVLILLFVLLYASVGLFEETLFRGLVLPVLLRKWGSTRKGIYAVVILSSTAFGALHLVNFMAGRRTLFSTGVQMLFALFFGVFFAACFLRNRSIWPVIFAHALFDLCGNLHAITPGGSFGEVGNITPQGALIAILLTLPLLLYGLFLLKKVKPESLDSVGIPAK